MPVATASVGLYRLLTGSSVTSLSDRLSDILYQNVCHVSTYRDTGKRNICQSRSNDPDRCELAMSY